MWAKAKRLPPTSSRSALARLRAEAGASAVEFALIASLLFMVILGMFSGGLAYSRKLALVHAAREGARYGVTLCYGWDGTTCGPGAGVSVSDAWLDAVADRAVTTAAGNLAESWDGQYVCVAYIGFGSPSTSSDDRTRKREKSGTNPATYTNGTLGNPASWCFNDGRGANGNERRVQVMVRRNSRFEALLWSTNLTLESDSVGRYETTPPT